MLHKIGNSLFLAFAAAILLTVPLFWLESGWKWAEENVENREFAGFPEFPFQNLKIGIKRLVHGRYQEAYEQASPLVSRDWQRQVEQASSDMFPHRIKLIELAKRMDRGLILAAYLPFRDPAIPASTREAVMVLRDRPVFIDPPAIFDAKTRRNLDLRLENYADLIARYPQIHFYAFYFERPENSGLHPASELFPQADRGDTLRYFAAHKPEGLVFGSWTLESMEEYEQLYFHNDHHWNIRGAWKAYQGIYRLIAPHTPGISPMLELKRFSTVPEVKFCGSYASRTLFPCQPDPFEYAEVDLPPYATYVNHKKAAYGRPQDYLAGEFNRSTYTPHYGSFFGSAKALVEYDFDNQADRNLLFIGSSYTRAVQVYLASHYDHTYVVDLREYSSFSLGPFIQEHEIDDVIVLEASRSMPNQKWIIQP